MKSVLCFVCLLPLLYCAPQRGIRGQKRMQALSQQVQAMGTSMAHQLDSLFQGGVPNAGYGQALPGAVSNAGYGQALPGAVSNAGGGQALPGAVSNAGGAVSNAGYGQALPGAVSNAGYYQKLIDAMFSLSPTVEVHASMGPGYTRGPFKPISAQTPTTNNVDIVLVLDSSGSVGDDAFDNGKMAAKTIIQYINSRSPISTTGSRVGLIKFSSTTLTNVVFHIGSNNYLWDVISAIDRVTYDSGPATATAEALRQAKLEIERNSIQTNGKLVWVVTDGLSNEGGNPIYVANQLKDMGVKVCAVGIGSVNRAEIDGIASPGCAYYPTSFSTYVQAAEYALSKANSTAMSFTGINFGR